MIVAGIDPGSNATGYAFIRRTDSLIKVLEYGVLRSKPGSSLPDKLFSIFKGLTFLLDNYKPDHLALETAFFAKFPQAALVLGHTRGAIMIAARQRGIPIFEYEPRLIKRSVTGTGRASKRQVAEMVQRHLSLSAPPAPLDAADALAAAYCHLLRVRLA